jgi:hypothetical protein
LTTNTERRAEQVGDWHRQHESMVRIVSRSNEIEPGDVSDTESSFRSMTKSMPADVVDIH